ncbi:MAG: DUF5060 domain-containing protein [Verrucomicrobiota bacterium]
MSISLRSVALFFILSPLINNISNGASSDAPDTKVTVDEGRILATEFSIQKGFYVDQEKWLGVNPKRAKKGTASLVFPYRDGTYDVTLEMVGENDGQSTFEVAIEALPLGTLTAPTTEEMFATGPRFNLGWKNIKIHDGDLVTVKGKIHSADGKEWSRARWAAIRFTPADGKPLFEAAPATPSAKAVEPGLPLFGPRKPDGDGSVAITGELKQWHNVVLTLDGPFAHERDSKPNPFVDRQMEVTFRHSSGSPKYTIPAYFAADGNAGETSAESGTKWRAHLSPDKTGNWSYTIHFPKTSYDGITGSFTVAESDKSGRDHRARGRLGYVGERYLQFAGSGEYFLKAGADAPETLLAYADFDGTVALSPNKCPLKTWEPHIKDWRPGDPTWKGDKGKGLIGAINYLATEGVNAFSFLTYNSGGDGNNVWPHVERDNKLHFDCSKLDQWEVIFAHATSQGMFLHFKLQETENDDLIDKGTGKDHALDKGELGIERKTYLREIIARFGHHLALNWNAGEENTQSFEQLSAMIRFIRKTDAYDHHLVVHTYPNQQEKIYGRFLGKTDLLTGPSIQNSDVSDSHRDVLNWVTRSQKSGHAWVVSVDEAGNASVGTPPDPDWPGMQEALAKAAEEDRKRKKKTKAQRKQHKIPTIHEIRGEVLWGTLMAGGMGVEYYFGYRLPENDLVAEDWRSRQKTWDYSAIALKFFKDHQLPLVEMTNANKLVDNPSNTNDRYCLSKNGEVYLVYARKADQLSLDLNGAEGDYSVEWFNPRQGGDLQKGSVQQISGGAVQELGSAPEDPQEDWVILVRRV